MILSKEAFKRLFTFYSFLVQMIHYKEDEKRFIYCCEDIKKRKVEFIEYLKEINYLTKEQNSFKDISSLDENKVRSYITYLINQPDSSDKYLTLCDLLDRLKVIYTPLLMENFKYFIPKNDCYCYSKDERENDYMCPFRLEDEEYCIYLDLKDWYILDEIKLCEINLDEEIESF
jgi:hypothetical protein